MSNKLEDLEPVFRDKATKALELMRSDEKLRALGVVSIIIVETRRTLATQMAYYSRGRMGKPEYVRAMYEAAGLYQPTDKECDTPNTWTLKSKHIDGLAVDLCPSKDGKACWWDAPDAVWQRMAQIAEDCGVAAGYRWAPPKQDKPHFEAKAHEN